MASSLEELIDEFVDEGYDPEDAARAAMLVLKKRREGRAGRAERSEEVRDERRSAGTIARAEGGGELSLRADGGGVPMRRHDGGLELGTARGMMINNGDRRATVDYGNETPQEAGARWAFQEMNDPDGVYSMGGASAGGIFGGGAIATETYDPEARQRAAPGMQTEVMREMMHELRELRAERNAAALPAAPTQRHFVAGRGTARQLAAKKPR
jgi:hypothetical protein